MGKGKHGHKAQSISQELAEVGLIPRVLPAGFQGVHTVNITFGMHNVDAGGEVPVQHMDEPPVVALLGARNEGLYTFIFTDPDYPSPDNPGEAEFLHSLVVNVPGKEADSRAGHEAIGYSAPSKHQGQGTHRYLVTALEQPHGPLHVAAPKHRTHFKTQEFAKMNGLQFVGASFFLADWEAAPPAQHKMTSASSQQRVEKQTPTYAKSKPAHPAAEQQGEARGGHMAAQKLAYDTAMLEKSGLLQELAIDGLFNPRFPLHCAFGGQGPLSTGDELPPQLLDTVPSFTFEGAEPTDQRKLFTLVVLAKDLPTEGAAVLMLATNIPGSEGDAAVGDMVVPYTQPSNLAGITGLQRFVALLLEQSAPLEMETPEHRKNFPLGRFMKEHAPEGESMMPIAAGTMWLGTYKQ